MLKTMMLLALTVGALAVPAAADAQPLLHDSQGDLPIGTEVTLTSTNMVTKTPLGELKCDKQTVHGTVTKNDTTSAVIGSTTATVEGCNTPITNPTAGTMTISSNGTAVAMGVTFVMSGLCDYVGAVPYLYATDSDTLNVVGKEQFTGPGACGKLTTAGSFTLETSGGEAVFIR